MTKEITTKDPRGAKKKLVGDRRTKYLEGLVETGRHSCASLNAGVNKRTALRVRDEDPDFAEECENAIEGYHAFLYDMVRERIREKSDRILELELKRVDPSYRDKPLIDVNVGQGGGVIMGVVSKPAEKLQIELKANNEKRIDPTIDPDMEI
jgi:hypothetical protein